MATRACPGEPDVATTGGGAGGGTPPAYHTTRGGMVGVPWWGYPARVHTLGAPRTTRSAVLYVCGATGYAGRTEEAPWAQGAGFRRPQTAVERAPRRAITESSAVYGRATTPDPEDPGVVLDSNQVQAARGSLASRGLEGPWRRVQGSSRTPGRPGLAPASPWRVPRGTRLEGVWGILPPDLSIYSPLNEAAAAK